MGIVTNQGDDGFTGLYSNGERVRKDHSLIEYAGSLDELDAFLALGEIILKSEGSSLFAGIIEEIRKQIHAGIMPFKLQELPLYTGWIERQIDLLEKENPVHNFEHSWTKKGSAVLNVARTVCRRCERHFATAEKYGGRKNPEAEMLVWLNRLSDLLFLLAVSEEQRLR